MTRDAPSADDWATRATFEMAADEMMKVAKARRDWIVLYQQPPGQLNAARVMETGRAVAEQLPTQQRRTRARALDLACSNNHRLAEVLRVPGRGLALVVHYWVRNMRIATVGNREAGLVGVEEGHGLLAEWLDAATTLWADDGKFDLGCRRYRTNGYRIMLDEVIRLVPSTGHRRVVLTLGTQ